jgi:hypothetical protein
MSEQENTNDDSAVSLVKADLLVITPVLGRVKAAGAQVQVEGAPNNTRWVLDVEVPAEADGTVSLQILEHRSGRELEPDLMSFSITPTSPDAQDAHIHAEHKGSLLALKAKKISQPYSYRVAIDVMHSSTR